MIAGTLEGLLAIAALIWMHHERPRQMIRNPPWLMWGNSKTVTMQGTGASSKLATQQLIKIAYGRPENWTWLFTATILEVSSGHGLLNVAYNLTTGVGRTQVNLPRFEQFGWTYTATGGGFPGAALVGIPAWSSTVSGPQRAQPPNLNPQLVPPNMISEFPGQDIQLNADIYFSAPVGESITVQVDAILTPKVHIRPEWFKGNMDYGEEKGR